MGTFLSLSLVFDIFYFFSNFFFFFFSSSLRYWCEVMSGMQLECVGKKGPKSATDFEAMIEEITLKDLQLAMDVLKLGEGEKFTKVIGRTVQDDGRVVGGGEGEDGEHLVSSRGGGRSGTALMM
jgi:hypothetical protein